MVHHFHQIFKVGTPALLPKRLKVTVAILSQTKYIPGKRLSRDQTPSHGTKSTAVTFRLGLKLLKVMALSSLVLLAPLTLLTMPPRCLFLPSVPMTPWPSGSSPASLAIFPSAHLQFPAFSPFVCDAASRLPLWSPSPLCICVFLVP